ncbi:integrase arm-type DNA-binding domain-containing protein [Pseudomonas sp. ANT_J28]|uniref:phage integrase central domain-containing protein n=1 Tax=Pseudomonas sp. ANT_J28 TaxID=2597352 RepID=UPI0015B59321|nr:integrase arm-type DNA-binding domain-containing protein [Pseudomonas sp. ANT_J28]
MALAASRTNSIRFRNRLAVSGLTVQMLGGSAEVSLAKAREKAAEARKLSKSGVDPLTNRDEELERRRLEKEAQRLAQATARAKATPFKDVALDYIAAHRAGWKNAKHAQQWENTLATYAFKVIGELPTQEVAKDPTCATGTADFQVEAVAIIGHSSQSDPDYFLYGFCRQ